MYRFRCSCSAFSLRIDIRSYHVEAHMRREIHFRVEVDDSSVVVQLEDDCEIATNKTPRQ